MTQVFLNYRRADEPFAVAFLDRDLSARFDADAVFLASKSIELGARWEAEMFDAVRRSTALLAVMGKNWLGERNHRGERRIDLPADYVRREILLAMELGKIVIPVRLETPRLTKDDLPEVLHPMLAFQDIELRFHSTGPDLDRLESKLRRLIPGLPGRREPVEAPARNYTNSTHNELRDSTIGTFHAGTSLFGNYGGPR